MSELINYNSTVHSFYLAFFGRPADPDGLKFWSEHLAAVDGDLSVIAASFANSDEAKVRFGDDTTAERIVEIYQQLFNRGPEPAGLVFWTKAVEQGLVTLADVAISILDGAQGTDADLAALREQAVADFTAKVDASGSDYAGYAAIDAARVLVRAVTPGASQEDIAKLVQAAVDFTDIASNNPAVVDAIATGSSLLALFDTKRGLSDPVTLVQALADVAEAAAGNPSTLESLLRGGGMAKVLEVMPARASLQDVVDALAKGGLPAAIDVVYPPQPTTPAPPAGITFKFAGVDHGPDDRAPNDNVTNQDLVDVDFSFTGSLQSGQKFQYSVDGGETWHTIVAVGKTLTVSQVDLWNGEGGFERHGFTTMDAGEVLTTKVQVRVADAADNTVKSFSQDIVFDMLRPYGELNFVRLGDGPEGDLSTGEQNIDATFSIDGFKEDVFVQWRLRGDENWTDIKPNNAGRFTLHDIDLSEADQTVEVRVLDAAGNVGSHEEWTIDGPAGDELEIVPSITGLFIESPVDGKAKLGGIVVDTNHQSLEVVAGAGVELHAQAEVVSGTLTVTPNRGGADLADSRGLTYTLGTVAGEQISGNYVWGFGGDDQIAGTEGDDFLMGGDGNDTIYGLGGNDRIAGGAGADVIHLSGVDTVHIAYMNNDTYVGTFVNNSSYELMDRIIGAKAGDSITVFDGFGDNGRPVVSDTYLTTTAQGQVAIVRGSMTANFFANPTGSAYMLQWTDSVGINSIILNNYQGDDLSLKFDLGMRTMILAEKPVVSDYMDISYDFGANGSVFFLSGSPKNVAPADTEDGLLDASGFALVDMATGSEVTWEYTGSGFGVYDNGSLELSRPLKAGAYEVSWDDYTFATENGTFGAGDHKFAGGAIDNIVQQGFWYKTEVDLDGQTHDGDGEGARYMFVAGDQATKVITNDNNDVVLASTGTVHLSYLGFSTKGQDLILGFGADDTLTFDNLAAMAIDKNVNGEIDWEHGPERLISSDTEAVYFETDGAIDSSELGSDQTATITTLRNNIDVSDLVLGDQLLILAHNLAGTGAALLHFTDKDGNGDINHGEIELIGIFADGVPDMAQISVGPLV